MMSLYHCVPSQINGDGEPPHRFYGNPPVPPPHPPPQTPTPRTPRLSHRAQSPVPPPRGRTPPPGAAVGARGGAVKRSPSAPLDWPDGAPVDRNDVSSAGSSGKRKRSDYEVRREVPRETRALEARLLRQFVVKPTSWGRLHEALTPDAPALSDWCRQKCID